MAMQSEMIENEVTVYRQFFHYRKTESYNMSFCINSKRYFFKFYTLSCFHNFVLCNSSNNGTILFQLPPGWLSWLSYLSASSWQPSSLYLSLCTGEDRYSICHHGQVKTNIVSVIMYRWGQTLCLSSCTGEDQLCVCHHVQVRTNSVSVIMYRWGHHCMSSCIGDDHFNLQS